MAVMKREIKRHGLRPNLQTQIRVINEGRFSRGQNKSETVTVRPEI